MTSLIKVIVTRGGAAAAMAALMGVGAAQAANDKAAGTISAGKLAKNAKDYYGKTVTVKAEVEDVLDSNMFTLDEDALLAGSDVLVIVPRGVAATLAHDQKVMVTGTVRRFVKADLDRDYDWFDDGKLVNVKTKVDWESRPVVIAETIRTESGAEISMR
jgi:hypothetical protein